MALRRSPSTSATTVAPPAPGTQYGPPSPSGRTVSRTRSPSPAGVICTLGRPSASTARIPAPAPLPTSDWMVTSGATASTALSTCPSSAAGTSMPPPPRAVEMRHCSSVKVVTRSRSGPSWSTTTRGPFFVPRRVLQTGRPLRCASSFVSRSSCSPNSSTSSTP